MGQLKAKLAKLRRELLEHLSIPATCAVSIGVFGTPELRHIVDATWQNCAPTDMRLVIKSTKDRCAFALELANPSASQKADFEVINRCSTRPGPARDAAIEAEVRRICGEADRAIDRGTARGHIFNLGHGVPPNTDADAITRTVKMVHEL